MLQTRLASRGGRRIEIETLKLVGKGAYRRIDGLVRTLPTQSR